MISSVTYTGDGATRVFPVAFEIQGENYVVVFINDVAISDRTTYDIINNSIVFVEDSIPEASSNIEIVVASSPTELGDLDAPPSITQTVLDNLDNINIIANNIDLIRSAVDLGGTTIVQEGAGITNVNTLPNTADMGTVVYLVPETALYVYDGTEWDKVGVSDNEAPTNTDWTLWSTIPNTSTYISAQGGQVTVTDNGVSVPTLSVSTGSYSGDTVTHATDVAYANLTVKKGFDVGIYISVKLYNMYNVFFGRKPELAGYVYWMKEAIANGWSEYQLATAVYSAGRYAVVSTPIVETTWSTWTPIAGANVFMSAYGGQVTVINNGTSLPSISIVAGTYTPSNPTQYAIDTTYVTTTSRGFKTGDAYLATIIYGVYDTLLGKKPELAGYAYWMREAVTNAWSEYTLVNAIYTAAKANIVSSATNNDAVFVETVPTTPNIGDKVLNVLDGSVSTWDGTKWVVQEYVPPSASSTTGIQMVDTLPASGNEGDIIYNTSNDKMYIYLSGTWSAYFDGLAAELADGIGVVSQLPLVVVNGNVIYNSSDKKLYEGVNGLWTQVVEPVSTANEVADASITVAKFASNLRPVEIFTDLPTTNNTVGRTVYKSTDGQLYRYTASGWTNAVPATAISGQITKTQIADGSIETPKLAVGAVKAGNIDALAITAGKIAVNAVTAGTIEAGAVNTREIYAGAVKSDQIYAGAILSTHITANQIKATHILAGEIKATHISSNQILAGHILAGEIQATHIKADAIQAIHIDAKAIKAEHIDVGQIKADHLDVYALTGKYANFDSSKLSSSTKGQTVVVANGGTVATVGMSGTGNMYGVVGECKNSSGQSVLGWGQTNDSVGVLGNSITKEGVRGDSISGIGVHGSSKSNKGVYGTTTSASYAAVHGLNSSSYNGVLGYSTSGWGVQGQTGSGTYGLGTNNKTYSAQGYAPFTGSHICLMPKSQVASIGSLVAIKEAHVISIDQCFIIVEPTTTANQKSVIGVVSALSETIGEEILSDALVKNFIQEEVTENDFTTTVTTYTTIKEEFQSFVAMVESGEYVQVEVNALGEGAMLVCSSGGNIEVGDYLVSSTVQGLAMKQADDILRASTVGKAMQGVNWSKETATTKLIAVTYHAG